MILAAARVDIVELLGPELGLRYHRELIDALKSGDKALCESLMDAHIEETIQSILKKTKKYPGETLSSLSEKSSSQRKQ